MNDSALGAMKRWNGFFFRLIFESILDLKNNIIIFMICR